MQNYSDDITLTFKAAKLGSIEIVDLINLVERWTAEGRTTEVLELYQIWIEHTSSPMLFVACFNYGVLLAAQKNHLKAEEMYRKSLEYKPDFIQAYLNLGNCLEQQNREEEALEQWRNALKVPTINLPASLTFKLHALNNLGRLLESRRQFQEALSILNSSFTLDSTQRDVLYHLVHLREKICAWPVIHPPRGVSKTDMMKGTSPLAMLALLNDPEQQLSAARQFVEYKYKPDSVRLAPDGGYNHDKIRIGYLSSDLSMHAVSLLTVELFELHDRKQFEVYGFCWSKEDGTAFRQRVVNAFDHFIRIGEMDDKQASEEIRANEIDVLIDLQGLTSGARPMILASRPAPLQITYLGFPGPTGLPWIDYVIADRYLIPEEIAKHFTEKPLYMPRFFQVSDSKREVAPKPTRAEYSLPEDAFVFCSFNNNYKYTPEMFAAWMRILKKVPKSILWLLADNEWAHDNLLKEAKKHGIKNDRLIFAPRVVPAAYLARYQLADLFLDTFPFNGGTTANDALFMGLPLLTLSGRTFASRMAGSLLHNLGLPELITTDLKEYEEKAIKLAKKRGDLGVLKNKLADSRQSSPVFNIPLLVKDIETSLIQAVEENRKPRLQTIAAENLPVADAVQQLSISIDADTSAPYFSIIIPTHDRPLLLDRALASVKSQSFKNVELIVVADSSDPATYQTVSSHLGDRDFFIKRSGAPGPAHSRNTGLDHATGRHVIFLDDDDALDPGYLEKLHVECEKNRDAVLFCNFHVVQEDRQTAPFARLSETFINIGIIPQTNLYIKNFIPNSTVTYPRAVLEHKRFYTHLKLNEDWDFLLNVLEDSELRFIDICGPRIYKDDPKLLNRRGTQNHNILVFDLIHIYRRWAGKTPEIKQQRQQILLEAGVDAPIEWL